MSNEETKQALSEADQVRRRGDRRIADVAVADDRRTGDRRDTPGIRALFRTLFRRNTSKES